MFYYLYLSHIFLYKINFILLRINKINFLFFKIEKKLFFKFFKILE
jgi:hypothetical protein